MSIVRRSFLLAVCGITIACTLTALAIGHRSPVSFCTRDAVAQLPSQLVRTIAAAQIEHQVPAGIGETIVSRKISASEEALAFRSFEPKYCGYTGNVNDRIDSQARLSQDTAAAFAEEGKDLVILTRHGIRVTEQPDGVCISNTPPTAAMVNGHIVMHLSCDRLYPDDTWTAPRIDASVWK